VLFYNFIFLLKISFKIILKSHFDPMCQNNPVKQPEWASFGKKIYGLDQHVSMPEKSDWLNGALSTDQR
jgi:hypothetical protein